MTHPFFSLSAPQNKAHCGGVYVHKDFMPIFAVLLEGMKKNNARLCECFDSFWETPCFGF